MKKNLIRGGLFAAALALALPVTEAPAQEFNSLYVTPKILYGWQTGDLSDSKWRNGVWSSGVLGGDDEDSNFGFGLAFGNDFSFSTSYPVRLEAEYIYHGDNSFSKGPSLIDGTRVAKQSYNVKAHTLMVNAFYDINLDTFLTPYIGGGLGASYLKSSYKAHSQVGANPSMGASASGNTWNFAWNIGGGVSYAFDNTMALDVGYRYFDLGTAEPGSISNSGGFRGGDGVDVTAHELSVGLRFSGF